MNRQEQSEQPNEHRQQSSRIESEVLIEKVREIELTKIDSENFGEKISDKNNTAKILNERQDLSPPMPEDEARRRMRSMSRRGFLIGGATAVFGYLGYGWLREPEQQSVFTRTFNFNENLSQTFYSPKNLAPEFPRELASARVNGMIGLGSELDAQTWRLQVVGLANPRNYSQFSENITFQGADNAPRAMDSPPAPNDSVAGLVLSLDEIKSLPRAEMTTELKCIEGWSIIVNWVGVRFSDFVAKFAPPENTQYVSLVTPDRGYYVGWDMPSILHPQTLLAYEMNGQSLTPEHGAPLRLVTATKYGIKQIKRIGRIEFTNERPRDYWAEQGYDWYSGL